MSFQFSNGYFKPHVDFKRVHPAAITPQYMTDRAAGFDLACIEDIVLPNELPKLFSTGLVIATLSDHMLLITHRSSTPRKYGVTVMNGIVDEDYCGDDDVIKLQVRAINLKFNWDMGPLVIPAGTRIAQGIFVPVSHAWFFEAQEMGESRGGYGSTG